ncbi:MAG: valine--tRNA ligase [Candidatus Eisenbacteria bacterium]|uniref:Valine--tRNA ligase n=1 Tax=Eiseniibacteriota bacterium TaxID=2212470 RepID=A0A938BR21_UNCEI|nr:valine--tRNA ligase [Candidatus Eisenbacteria bacterium]
MREMPKAYDPSSFEKRWYEGWEAAGRFRPRPSEKGGYVIVIPPPNVTGALTIGHVLNNTIQDVLIRWQRMQGLRTLWLPGTDHAGIATQNVVKKDLSARGVDYRSLGREAFVAEVWKWKEAFGGKITKQLRLLGCSCDWERERFTLDPGLSGAVEEVFRRLYAKGLIYRGEYLIHWCVGCQTAVSDEEVEHQEMDARFWHIKYPVKGSEQGIVVATTRPETMLGDTAVAIHPGDERYRAIKDRTLILPLVGREIPIIEDAYVDPAFGTGALKITPGHDPNDFEIGRRYGLEVVSVIGADGRMNERAGRFAGMDRFEARKAVVEELKREGLLVKVEPFRHAVGHCYRCRTMIEPMVSHQWFVRMQPLAERAVAAARSGEVRFVPARWEKTYLHWLENVRDWCISRQLWWGHRIPVWYCRGCGQAVLSGGETEPCAGCGGREWRQDEDVLDTWFSSWLWPFSTLGWPEETEDLRAFYPTQALVTAPDIIFFWVARMVMAGYEFMGEKPFGEVYLHGVVRDEQGRKMSKSLGNSPDPIDLIAEFGADALRFTMLMLTPTGNDVLFGKKKIEVGRDFANKLWNAGRFILFNLRDGEPPAGLPPAASLAPEDLWILGRLEGVIAETDRMLAAYDFTGVAHLLYDFTWKEFCAWYLEIAKVRIQRGSAAEGERARRVLLWVYRRVLALLHPLMPFITEEIWDCLPGKEQELILGPWPAAGEWRGAAGGEPPAAAATGGSAGGAPDAAAQRAAGDMAFFQEVVVTVRNLRSEMNVQPAQFVAVGIRATEAQARVLASLDEPLRGLARIEQLTISPEYRKPAHAVSGVAGAAEVFVLLEGVLDLDAERGRLMKELRRVEGLLEGSRKRLVNEDFLQRARPGVVEQERGKLEQLEAARARIERALQALEE